MSLNWLALGVSLVALAISLGCIAWDHFVLTPRHKRLVQRLSDLERNE